MPGKAGIYIHVPFCRRKCPYCDFYSVPLSPFAEDLADAYTEAVLRAVETHPFGDLAADTLYFGGGTPALLGPRRLERMVAAARNAFGLRGDAEITLEANPGCVDRAEFVSLRKAGFNRISFGVQSLSDGELRSLGRGHTAAEARQAVADAGAAGFDNIGADLMLAIPGQTLDSLAASVGGLCALPVTHISAYLLKIEEGTPFGAQKNALSLPDEDETAELYLHCVHLLEERGFAQYEISNFARNGRVSRHNLKYWRGRDYLGIGPAAHSFVKGKRFFFPRDLAAFLAAEQPFGLAVPDGDGGGMEERLLLRLRLSEGLGLDDSSLSLSTAQQESLLRKARELETRGLVQVRGRSVALTPEGFLLSNPVTVALLDAVSPTGCESGGRYRR